MTSRLRLALAVSTIVGAAAFASVAEAQQNPPAQPAPSASAQQPPAGGSAAAPAPRGAARGDRARRLSMLNRFARMSPQDRAAIIDARLAALKAGLELTPDQQKLWQPLEGAVRDGISKALDLRQKFITEGRPADPMQRLERLSQAASTRADLLKNFVNAAQPLYASLTPDQKRRIPLLLGFANRIGGAALAGQGPGRGGRPNVGMGGEGGRPGMAEGMGGDQGGRYQETWRQRMRQRMERMNQARRDWRGPWGDSDRGDWRDDQPTPRHDFDSDGGGMNDSGQ